MHKVFTKLVDVFYKLFFINFKLTYLINRIVCWFDKKYYDDILTLNYIITAQKTND